MKKINLFLLALIAIVLSSCSFISIENEDAIASKGKFTLYIGDSNSRKIGGYGPLSASNIQITKVKFQKLSEDSSHAAEGEPIVETVTKNDSLFWYLSEGIYDITVYGKANGLYEVKGTAREVRVTKFGGSATVTMDYVYHFDDSDYTGNLDLTVNLDSDLVSALLDESIMGLNPAYYNGTYTKTGNNTYTSDNSVYFSAKLINKNHYSDNTTYLSVSEKWTLSEANPALTLNVKTEDPIYTDFYDLVISVQNKTKSYDFIISDKLVEIIPGTTRESIVISQLQSGFNNPFLPLNEVTLNYNFETDPEEDPIVIEKRFLLTESSINILDYIPEAYQSEYTYDYSNGNNPQETTIEYTNNQTIDIYFTKLEGNGSLDLTFNVNTDLAETLLDENDIYGINPKEYNGTYKKEGNTYKSSTSQYFMSSLTNRNSEKYTQLHVSEEWVIEENQDPQLTLKITTNSPVSAGFYDFDISLYYYDSTDQVTKYSQLVLEDNLFKLTNNETFTHEYTLSEINTETTTDANTYFIDLVYHMVGQTDNQYSYQIIFPNTDVFNIMDYVPAGYEDYILNPSKNPEFMLPSGNYSDPEYPESLGNNKYKFKSSGQFEIYFITQNQPSQEIVTEIPVALYRNTGSTGTIKTPNNTTITNSIDFYTTDNTDYYTLGTDYKTITGPQNRIIINYKNSDDSINESFKIVDFAVKGSGTEAKLYIAGEVNTTTYKIYIFDMNSTGTTSKVLTDSVTSPVVVTKNAVAEKIHLAIDSDNVYYMTKSGNLFQCETDLSKTEDISLPNGSLSLVLNTGNTAGLAYTITDFLEYNGNIYILVTFNENSEGFTVGGAFLKYNISEASMSVISSTVKSSAVGNSTLLGPRKILGFNNGSIYIADEGVYGDFTTNTYQWQSRVLVYKTSSSSFSDSILMSNSTSDTTNHFESNYDATSGKYIALTE